MEHDRRRHDQQVKDQRRPGRQRQDPQRQDPQRIDKWLWCARVVKSRTLAARLVEAGHVRLNGKRMTQAARIVGAGDVLTIALERQVRVLRVAATGERRGPFQEACLLFEDLSVADSHPLQASRT